MVATAGILLILATAILPMAKATQQKAKELELRRTLREIRNAIDEYKARCDPSIPIGDGKKLADRQSGADNCGDPYYPTKLEILVEGAPLQAQAQATIGAKMKFLRRIPIDPMTGKAEWGLVAYATPSIPLPGAARRSGTSTPRVPAPPWTGPSTTTGSPGRSSRGRGPTVPFSLTSQQIPGHIAI